MLTLGSRLKLICVPKTFSRTISCSALCLTPRKAQVEVCAQNVFSYHLLFRVISHTMHSTPSISLASTSPSVTGSGSRLITYRIHCADSRDLGGDGFTDPEPRAGYEPIRTVDNPIVSTLLKRVRFQKLRTRAKS